MCEHNEEAPPQVEKIVREGMLAMYGEIISFDSASRTEIERGLLAAFIAMLYATNDPYLSGAAASFAKFLSHE